MVATRRCSRSSKHKIVYLTLRFGWNCWSKVSWSSDHRVSIVWRSAWKCCKCCQRRLGCSSWHGNHDRRIFQELNPGSFPQSKVSFRYYICSILNFFSKTFWRYTNVVKQMSKLSKDRPMNAQDSAVFWVEYVIRHRGAPHLHYPGADLNFFQFNSIDVILFLFAVFYVIIKVLKTICSKLCCSGGESQKKKPKRKTNWWIMMSKLNFIHL